MSEPDPFASPYQVVRLPGQEHQPVGEPPPMLGWPAPMPAPNADHSVLLARPAALTTSFWCWVAATVLVVVGLPAVFLTDSDAFAQSIYDDSQIEDPEPLTMAEARVGARVTSLLFAFFFAVLAVPYVVATIQLRRARNWARVLLSVLGGLGLLFGLGVLIAFVVDSPWAHWLAGIIWSLLFIGCVLLGIILMFLPATNDYVRLETARR